MANEVSTEQGGNEQAPANGAGLLRKIAGNIKSESYKAAEAKVKEKVKLIVEHQRGIRLLKVEINNLISDYELSLEDLKLE